MVLAREMSRIQCTIVGDKRVGKSTIIRGLGETGSNVQTDLQNNNYESTIFDNIAGK